MSHYILRREGRDYPAPSLDALRQWAKDGRVLPADMIFSPQSQTWQRANALDELAHLFQKKKQSSEEAKQQFWLKKGRENYPAADREIVLQWVRDGNVAPEDMIYHPGEKRWFQACDSPTICDLFPARVGRLTPKLSRDQDPMRPKEAARGGISSGFAQDILSSKPKPKTPEPVEAESRQQTRPLHPGINPLSAVVGKALTPTASQARPSTDDLLKEKPDPKALMRVFYDVARTFMVTRDMRPGETLSNECKLPSTGDDFKGWTKKDIFIRLAERMQAHLEGPMTAAQSRLNAEQQEAMAIFCQQLDEVLDTFSEVIPCIGIKPPARVVVGNVGHPKMTPDEEEAMLRVDFGLKGLFAVKLT